MLNYGIILRSLEFFLEFFYVKAFCFYLLLEKRICNYSTITRNCKEEEYE